jgi:class 3 adenylate cyclase
MNGFGGDMKPGPEHAITAGTVFEARYEILAELGAGGSGTVYEARQLATGQLVAIKVLRPVEDRGGAPFERRLARFQREMKLCGQMHHPNIVRLFDSGKTASGLVYSVFEFAPGKDLSNVLAREGRLDPVEAKHLMLQVLDALACAHAEGVVHRDLKPANIMVIPTGARRNALVLDFGIGVFTEDAQGVERVRITAPNESLGTPAYAAPEQLRGHPPTPRSDLYAWGLVFLECLTGKRVITGDSVGYVLFKHLEPSPIPMPAALADHALARILTRAVAKDPRERQVTAQGLLRELEVCDVTSLRQRIGLVMDVPPARGSAVTETVQVGPALRPGPEASPRGDTPGSAPLLEGERRQLTAVCCGLVATSAAPATTDVEEIDEVLATLQERGAEIVRRFEGRIAGALGDQVLFYFGYPAAREDDTLRAGRAALELVRNLGEESEKLIAERQIRVEIRIGVHTGLVVAREPRESTPGGLGPMLGTTAKVAARLCALASPGTILISGETARMVRDHFILADERPLVLDGGARTIEVVRLGGQQILVPADPQARHG